MQAGDGGSSIWLKRNESVAPFGGGGVDKQRSGGGYETELVSRFERAVFRP